MASVLPVGSEIMPFPDLDVDPTFGIHDGNGWMDSSQLDGAPSVSASEPQHQIQAFAKIEFDDGEFYMNTYAVELGRDVRAARLAALIAKQSTPTIRKRSASDGGSAKSFLKAQRDSMNRYHAVSQNGGVNGAGSSTMDEDNRKAPSIGSSSQHPSRKSSMNTPKTDYNALAIASLPEGALDNINSESGAALPAPDLVPLIPIHPPTSIIGPSTGHKSLSRKHLRIAFNFESHEFEVEVLGRNGVFVDEFHHELGDVVPLVSGSVLQVGPVWMRFVLPDVPPGETGAEMEEDSDTLAGMADSDEGEEDEGQARRGRKRRISDLHAAIQRKKAKEVEDMPKPKRKGPGRPPKNGIISKREQALLARQAREDAKAAANGEPRPYARGKGKTGKHEPDPSSLQPNGKRKYTKRKKALELEQNIRESTEQTDSMVPDGGLQKPKEKSKPIKPPRSPSPVFDEATLTPEQLAKPQQSYVVLIHEALSNSKTGQMSLPQIYRAIERRYPFFKLRVQTQGWQSSVRHNLSQHAAFKKIERDGKGWMWGLVPEVSIEKEKKRRATPPPQPQPQYYQPPPNYSQQYQYPNMPAQANQRLPQFPFGAPRAPFPPTMGATGFPLPFAKPQSEATYKSPYGSSAPTAPAESAGNAMTGSTANGASAYTSSPYAQQPSMPNASMTNGTTMATSANNNGSGVAGLSPDVLAAVQKFKASLIDSMDDKTQAEKLVSAAIQKTFPTSVNGNAHTGLASSSAEEKAVSSALSSMLSSMQGSNNNTNQPANININGAAVSSFPANPTATPQANTNAAQGAPISVQARLPKIENVQVSNPSQGSAAADDAAAMSKVEDPEQGQEADDDDEDVEAEEDEETDDDADDDEVEEGDEEGDEEDEEEEADVEAEDGEDEEAESGEEDEDAADDDEDGKGADDDADKAEEAEELTPPPTATTPAPSNAKPTVTIRQSPRKTRNDPPPPPPQQSASPPPRGRRRKRTGSDESAAAVGLGSGMSGVGTRASGRNQGGMALRESKRVAT